MEIKVLGSGCASCDRLFEETQKALAFLGIEATLSKLDRPEDLKRLGVRMAPALIIDGETKAEGRVPDQAELTTWITTAALNEEAERARKGT